MKLSDLYTRVSVANWDYDSETRILMKKLIDAVGAARDWRAVAGKYMGEGYEIVTPLEYEKRKVFGDAIAALGLEPES